jgi:hypothetical protein
MTISPRVRPLHYDLHRPLTGQCSQRETSVTSFNKQYRGTWMDAQNNPTQHNTRYLVPFPRAVHVS